LKAEGPMVPDSALNRAFFVQQDSTLGGGTYDIVIFDIQTQTLLKTIPIGPLAGAPTQMVRWGTQGLAFLTDTYGTGGGLLYILQGLNPSSAMRGTAAGITVTVTGSNFTSGSTVEINGTVRATTFVSATQLTFQLTEADQAFPTYLSVGVSNTGHDVSVYEFRHSESSADHHEPWQSERSGRQFTNTYGAGNGLYSQHGDPVERKSAHYYLCQRNRGDRRSKLWRLRHDRELSGDGGESRARGWNLERCHARGGQPCSGDHVCSAFVDCYRIYRANRECIGLRVRCRHGHPGQRHDACDDLHLRHAGQRRVDGGRLRHGGQCIAACAKSFARWREFGRCLYRG
jgi:hypothetical protein